MSHSGSTDKTKLGGATKPHEQRIRQLSEQVPDAESYHRKTPREQIKEKRKAVLGKGVATINVPVDWLRRYGMEAALYLALHVSYAGGQTRGDGYQYNSALEIYAKTGIKPHRQPRIREYLAYLGVIQTKKGGIGNKWMVAPNIPLIELADEIERKEAEIIEDARSGDTLEDAKGEDDAAFKTVSEKLSRQSQESFEDSTQTHNRESTEKQTNQSSSELTHVSEPARSLVVVEDDGRKKDDINQRCVDVLKPVVDFDASRLSQILTELAKEYGQLDPLAVSKHIAKHATEPIRSPGYLRKCFKDREEKRKNGDESCSVSSCKKAGGSEDKPRRADWYEAFYGVTASEVQRLIDDGATHSEIMAALRKEIRQRKIIV
jgi:hypothetical protein